MRINIIGCAKQREEGESLTIVVLSEGFALDAWGMMTMIILFALDGTEEN